MVPLKHLSKDGIKSLEIQNWSCYIRQCFSFLNPSAKGLVPAFTSIFFKYLSQYPSSHGSLGMMMQFSDVDKSIQTDWESTFSKLISNEGNRQLPWTLFWRLYCRLWKYSIKKYLFKINNKNTKVTSLKISVAFLIISWYCCFSDFPHLLVHQQIFLHGNEINFFIN